MFKKSHNIEIWYDEDSGEVSIFKRPSNDYEVGLAIALDSKITSINDLESEINKIN